MKPQPEQLHTVNPYLAVADARRLIAFLQAGSAAK